MTIAVRSIFITLCSLVLAIALPAQTSQAPLPTDPSAAPNAATPEAAPYKLILKVRRVIVDVAVTDAKGKPVEGLKSDDFKVLEDGVAQPLRSFDEHAATPEGPSQHTLDLHLPPNTFSNLVAAPSDKPVTILLYDMLNTPQDALPFAHEELVRFIKKQKGTTKTAIFILTDRIHMLQGFTDDETRLMAAVDSKKSSTRVTQLRLADTGADETALLAADPTATATQPQQPQATSSSDSVLAQLQDAENSERDFEESNRIQTTVEAFADIARFVALVPGRKNLIWLAGSFPVEIWPGRSPNDGSGAGGFDIASRLDGEMRAAQDSLKDSRVAIYPIDVHGVAADPHYGGAAAQPNQPQRTPLVGGGAPPPPTFGVQQGAVHATMDAIADTTGGHAFYGTNDIQGAIADAVRQGSAYYTMTYSPSDTKDDGGERKIKVSLNNPNYQLTYRHRYLAYDDANPAASRPLVLDMNMQHGTPNSSELFFEAKVIPVGGVVTASPGEVASLKDFLQTKAKGKRTKVADGPQKVQHYDVNFAVIGRQLEMPQTTSGQYATDMQFGLAAYTEDSELLNGMEVSIKNAIPAAQFHKIETDGYHASMIFVVPVDAVALRIAVRDDIGNKTGTMEVPLPLPAPKNTAAAGQR